MKKIITGCLSLCLAALILIGAYGYVLISNAAAPGKLPENKIVLIERGKGVSAIGNILEQNGVIDSALSFKIITAIQKNPRPMKAGEYEFTMNISMKDAMEMLREGKVFDRKVTFPEGVTSWQIVEILKSRPDLTGEMATIPLDGTLLPETYHYVKDAPRAEILDQMTKAMEKTVSALWPSRAADLPIKDEKELLVLASIVEKETGVAAERAKVAGVFINRLRRGIPLQSDPTVIYGITKGVIEDAGQGPLGRRLLTRDLETPSPYNTYLNAGLPPTPIANPGKDSIRAVLNPENHDYIFFVADGTGGHIFARTLSEHNANVAKWRQIRKNQ